MMSTPPRVMRALASVAIAGLLALIGSEALASTPSLRDRTIPGLSVQMAGLPGGLSEAIERQLARQMGAPEAGTPAKAPLQGRALSSMPIAGATPNTAPTASQRDFVLTHQQVAAKVSQSSGIPAQFMLGQATMASLAQAGKAKLVGNQQVWQQLASTLGNFDPWFEVFPGPKTTAARPALDPFTERPRARAGID